MSKTTFVPFDWTGLDEWKPDADKVFYEHRLWEQIVLRAEVTSGGLRFWVGSHNKRGAWHDLRPAYLDSEMLATHAAILRKAADYADGLRNRWQQWMQANDWKADDA